jgi:hypothetical protein
VEIKIIIKLLIFTVSLVLFSCGSPLVKNTYNPTASISKIEYLKSKESKGLVLLAASGKRTWSCGSYENAELRSVGFDRLSNNKEIDSPPDFIVNNSQQGFSNYAYMLEPGTYALSYLNIKVASSAKSVGYITANRSSLLEKGGTFIVKANEAVYIGHFGLDCAYGPTMWRYYAEDENAFDELVSSYKSQYSYLSLDNVFYRLFSTKDFGHEFTLE